MNSRYCFTPILGGLIAAVLFITTAFAAQPAGFSARERAMKAAQQLRDYHQRLAVQSTKDAKMLSAARAQVSLSLNRAFKTASTIFYQDDMESGTNGWTSAAYTGADLWHQTTAASNSPVHSWWAGDDLTGTYSNGSRVNTALISPAIDLTGAAAPVRLLFTENYFTEAGWDFCMVDVSTDGGTTWTPLRGGYGSAPSGDSYGWTITSLDLSAYAGQTINIRFYFDTHDSLYNDFTGWYIDNVLVFDQGGMITGKTFFDANNDGIKDSTDRGVKDWLVTATGTGPSAGISITTKTNIRGKYWLPLPLGDYTITEELQPGWVQTFPAPFPSHHDIVLATADTLVDSVWFGNFTNASFVNGKMFNDIDKNGAFSAGDSLLMNWRVNLTDTLGNIIDFDLSDSLGMYQIFVFVPGHYIVSEVEKKGWVQSAPPEGSYTIDIPDLSTTLYDKDFGDYYAPAAKAIIGQVFNDRDRNHSFDVGEEGVAGVRIRLFQKGTGVKFSQYRTKLSDSSGYFEFLNVPPDTYQVKQDLYLGWWPSYPDSFYTFTLDSSMSDVNFGDYMIAPGSISGLKFNDLDGNGIMDGSDAPLDGWTIQLNGYSVYNTSESRSIVTDGSGNYAFNNLWPGTYTVSEVWRSGWRQTLPASLRPYSLDLGVEQAMTGIDFGNIQDSTFHVAFRTFIPEQLALAIDAKGKHLPIKQVPNKASWSTRKFVPFFEFLNYPVKALHLKFNIPVIESTIVVSKPAAVSLIDAKHVLITFTDPLQIEDTVVISGWSSKAKQPIIMKWWATYVSSFNSLRSAVNLVDTWTLLYPMPNAINALQAGAGTLLKVGLGGRNTVWHPTYKEVMKSLIERMDRMHAGQPRPLGKFATTGKPIKAQQKYLTPTKGNNILFAEAIALQANIKASDLGITDGGFGNLVFDEGTGRDDAHPFNGKTVRTIAGMLDQYMSGWNDTTNKPVYPAWYMTAGIDSNEIYRVIRLIDTSFYGPIDTASFGNGGLHFKDVKALVAVPYLKIEAASMQMVAAPVPEGAPVEPDRFTLNQNYPNPFNPSTTIEFFLTDPSIVTLKVYNTIGQEVATLINHEAMEDGWQQTVFSNETASLASGVYYYRLTAQTISEDDSPARTMTLVKKMILIK